MNSKHQEISTLPSHPSSNFDVNWLAKNDFSRIQREGTAPVNVTWIGELYAWIYERRSTDMLPKPVSGRKWNPHHNGYFPILWCEDDGGKSGISFISVWPAPRLETSALANKAQEHAADAALAWGHNNIHVNAIGSLAKFSCMRVLVRPAAIDQNSDCLAAFVATLLLQIGDRSTDDVCASGEWDIAARRFKPVNGFETKFRAAQEWGYRKLFYIEGQDDVPKHVENLELIPLPPDPDQAAEIIRNHLQPKADRMAKNIGWFANLAANASLVVVLFAIVIFQETILPLLPIRRWIEGIVIATIGIFALWGGLKTWRNAESTVQDRIFGACAIFLILGFSAICLFDSAGVEIPKTILWPWLLIFFLCGGYGLVTQCWRAITS